MAAGSRIPLLIMLLVLLVLLNILIFSDRVMGCVYAFILDLVRSAAV